MDRHGLMAGYAVLVIAGCSRGSSPAPSVPPTAARLANEQRPEVVAGLARIRQVTAPYALLDSAVASGYPRDVAQCIDHYTHNSAMGFHHVNRAHVDDRVDVDHPEILLYERTADGRYALTAVEYIVPFRVWPRDSIPPTLFGLPMNQELTLQIWYMHVWAWKENPFGLFADWHPDIRCAGATRPAP